MHWRNSNFQIRNFLAGKCHTPDEAYRMLRELYEDRDLAIKNAEASNLRTQAKILRAEEIINTAETSPADKLDAEADLAEVEAFKSQGDAVLAQGISEREYIQSLIDEIQPQRLYKNVSDEEAFQLGQSDEWKEELLFRAENFMATQGTIPHDHLATMRLHPAWDTDLLPHIKQIQTNMQDDKFLLAGHTNLLLEKQED